MKFVRREYILVPSCAGPKKVVLYQVIGMYNSRPSQNPEEGGLYLRHEYLSASFVRDAETNGAYNFSLQASNGILLWHVLRSLVLGR
jgi:hypothetical protein